MKSFRNFLKTLESALPNVCDPDDAKNILDDKVPRDERHAEHLKNRKNLHYRIQAP